MRIEKYIPHKPRRKGDRKFGESDETLRFLGMNERERERVSEREKGELGLWL